MSVTYSPLCDSSVDAYFAYLLTVSCNGADVYADGGVLAGDGSGDPGGDSDGAVGVEDGLSRSWSRGGSFLAFVDSLKSVSARRARSVGALPWGDGVEVDQGSGQRVLEQESGVLEPGCSEKQSVGEAAVETGGVVYGKHHKKNVEARERRKLKKRMQRGCEGDVVAVVNPEVSACARSGEAEVLSSVGSRGFPSYFGGCEEQLQVELRETRAKCFIEENKLRAARAAASVERMKLEQTTRLGESQFELRRQRVEVQLNNLREKRLGAATTGWVESIVSGVEESVAGTPSMSVGSVSPSSSMSVEQEKKLMCALNTMSVRIKELESKLAVFTGKGVCGDAEMSDAGHDWNGSFDDYMHLKAVEAQDLQETLDRDVY